MTRKHVLFVTERWCDCNPQKGLTNSEHNIFGSYETADIGDYSRFHFDEYYIRNKKKGDNELLNICRKNKPDMIFLSWANEAYKPKGFNKLIYKFKRLFNKNTIKPDFYNPQLKTLSVIKNELKIPISAIWWDSVAPFFIKSVSHLSSFVTLNIVVDSKSAYKRVGGLDNVLTLWAPQDSRIYFNPEKKRDIEISFAGSVSEQWPERKSSIDFLKENGINVLQVGGLREKPVPLKDYADNFMRSKISLNFSKNPDFIHQMKGRVFEVTLCGSLLLEEENPETSELFTPMVDYVPFKNKNDLLEKVRYYLNNENERRKIADNGYKKALTYYNSKEFWKKIFGYVFNTQK